MQQGRAKRSQSLSIHKAGFLERTVPCLKAKGENSSAPEMRWNLIFKLNNYSVFL